MALEIGTRNYGTRRDIVMMENGLFDLESNIEEYMFGGRHFCKNTRMRMVHEGHPLLFYPPLPLGPSNVEAVRAYYEAVLNVVSFCSFRCRYYHVYGRVSRQIVLILRRG